MKTKRRYFFHSLTFKNLGMFLGVFLIALIPLVRSYWIDTREDRIDILSSQLELIAQRSTKILSPGDFISLTERGMTNGEIHKNIIEKLKGIRNDFQVDNLVIIRRNPDGKFYFVADDMGQFYVTQPMFVHDEFPGTFRAATEAWEMGKVLRTDLFGFGTFEYLQVYAPVFENEKVVALILINKFAEDVDQAIRMKTARLLMMTGLLALLGAIGFWFFSNRMLSPLLRLKEAATKLSQGDLTIDIPAINRRDEVSDLNDSFRRMVEDLRRNKEQIDSYNSQLERSLAKVRLMEDMEKNLLKFVPKEVRQVLRTDPDALEQGKTEKDVTVLFLDLEGSTLLTESIGPENIDRLIEVYFSKFLDPIYENQGDITETAGDGLMIIFQGEDKTRHARNSVNAAIAIQKIIADVQEKLASQEEKIMINIGINSGKARVGFTKFEAISGTRITFTASGATTILAARLADLATRGSVLISSETMSRISKEQSKLFADNKFTSIGKKQLKNIHTPQTVFQVE